MLQITSATGSNDPSQLKNSLYTKVRGNKQFFEDTEAQILNSKLDTRMRGETMVKKREDAEKLAKRVAAMISDAEDLVAFDREAFNLPLEIWYIFRVQAQS